MFSLLAFRNLSVRPWRTAFLLIGYALGVAVMIVLLSIGEALVAQARDERLVGGGDVTVLPEGIDVEVLKTGGLGGLFFSIDHARFIYRQLLAAPRLSPYVAAAAPQIDGKLLYLRPLEARGGAPAEVPVRATGELPSRTALVGAAPPLAAGRWEDDTLDRRWRDPTPAELRHEIDHFHIPPPEARGDESWAEWHYFNVLSADRRRWAFVTLMVGGDVSVPRPQEARDERVAARWGGQVLVTLHEQGRAARRFSARVAPPDVRFSTTDANLAIGASSVTVLPDGRYAVRALATEACTERSECDAGGGVVRVALELAPTPGAYFPGAALGGEGVVSGYTVPALRGDASGSICVAPRRGGAAACERLDRVQGYHDHNWGVWRGVTWEWGAFRAGPFAVLYGRVQPPDSVAATQPLFVYLVDSLGFFALFRPREVAYEDARVVQVGGRALRVPSRARMVDVRGADTLVVELAIEDAAATDTRGAGPERGDALAARGIARPYFVQMKGTARLTGRIRGRPIVARGSGFFETYR